MKAFTSAYLLAFLFNSLGASAITVTLYNGAGASEGFSMNPDGSCFDLHGGDLQKYNDNLKYMQFPSGYQCALWQNYGCQGEHSDAFKSNTGKVPIADICDDGVAGSGFWPGVVSSFKCCPTSGWCAGSQPTCT